MDGIRNVFRFKLSVCIIVCTVCLFALGFWSEPLISLFLHEGSAEGDLALTLAYGLDYTRVMLWGLVPYALSQAYASTLRETGETVRPMAASIAAVVTNLVLNYLHTARCACRAHSLFILCKKACRCCLTRRFGPWACRS